MSNEKEFLILEVGKLRNAMHLHPLDGSDFKIENLRKEYAELTEIEDMYPIEY